MGKFRFGYQLKSFFHDQSGLALLFSLLVLTVITLWGVAMVTISTNEYRITNVSKKAVQAYYLAEAGLEEIIAKIKNSSLEIGNGEYTLENDVIPGGKINVKQNADLPFLTITSVGKVDNSQSTLMAQFRISYVDEPKETYEEDTALKKYVGDSIEKVNVECWGNLILENGCHIYGDVYCTGNLTLEEDSLIKGNIYSSGTVKLKNGSRVTGNIYCLYGQGKVLIQSSGKSAEILGDVYVGDLEDVLKMSNDEDDNDPLDNITGSIKIWNGIPREKKLILINWREGG
ncbi:MAG: polymer-forming cytoskeletal protein [Clostridia bacterium]|nr:polymer-forming cytoskeletal protein [Clostridia bacterium]